MDGDGNVVEGTARVLCVLTGSGTTPRPRKREMEQNRGVREVGGRFKREGTYVYLWLVHVNVWQPFGSLSNHKYSMNTYI